jgi:Zn-dependent protease
VTVPGVVSVSSRPYSSQPCRSCQAELPLSALVCPSCGSIVHSAKLTALAAEAELAERSGQLAGALGAWREALALLPQNSSQHAKILSKVQALSAKVPEASAQAEDKRAPESQPKRSAAKWIASLGALGLLLLKFKAVPLFLLGKGKLLLMGLTQAKTFFTMIIAIGVYTAAFGWWFALGLVLSIYVHEMGHVAWLSRYGIAATAPMFIPGLGAFIRLKQHLTTVAEDARVGLAGPIWGAAAAALALILGFVFESPILTAIGRVGAWINLFNLLPVWQLDGGRAFAALSRRQRITVAVGLWVLALAGVDGMLFLLAIAATARAAFPGAAPTDGDRPVLATYLILCVGLTAMVAAGDGSSLLTVE